MTIHRILLFPQDKAVLTTKSAEVKRNDPAIAELANDLRETLLANPGAGLAAPQMGILKRMTAVRFGQDKGEMEAPLVLVNPRIIKRGPLMTGFDGCLSLPGLATWDTPRPQWLVFTARDENWKPFEMRVDGIDARLVDHEIDHLDGKLFLDHMRPNAKLFFLSKDEKGEDKATPVKWPF